MKLMSPYFSINQLEHFYFPTTFYIVSQIILSLFRTGYRFQVQEPEGGLLVKSILFMELQISVNVSKISSKR